MKCTRIIILPGNGCGDVRDSNWYGWLEEKLKRELEEAGVVVELRNMPDPVVARREKWLPFVKDVMGCDEGTILVGHSSGAEAAMRYAEENKILGIILVGACHTHLDDANELASGYYPYPDGSNPWRFPAQVANTSFRTVFASTDDPFIPIQEQRHVAAAIDAKMFEYTDRGHFQMEAVPDILKHTLERVAECN
eukprot:TRINITY_DN19879_c0_g1_i1.p1 TRINITY_DN19879_c0_g1~~TRINITY_DN19879_c0_g1_i1.p1  ORF type:complete len:207 (+),score=52.72 TRINITY_DN19879_c0_g1_i1:42-623(+)